MAVSTKVLPNNALDLVKKSKLLYSALRRVRFLLGTMLGSRVVPGIPGRCHYNDFMLTSTSAEQAHNYYNGAVEFVNILENALNAIGRSWSDLDKILEVGCGYGRIVRVLKDRIDPKKIYVNDVLDEGAKFTTSEFNVNQKPILEKTGKEFSNYFDLIYLLSVYTHMTRGFVKNHIRLAGDSLKEGGLLVFTTQGWVSARTAERYKQFWLNKDDIINGLSIEGYYYKNYPHYTEEYGMTWFAECYVRKIVEEADLSLKFVSYSSAELDKHQDVFVFQKRANTLSG